jgi:MFS family permease
VSTSTTWPAVTPAATPGPVSRWVAATVGGLPKVFWIVFTGSALARLGFWVVPFLAFYLAGARHLTPAQITVVMTCFGAGWTLAGPFGGWLADRLGRRVPLVAGSTGAAVAYVALAVAHTPRVIAGCALLAGLTFDLYRPAIAAVITDRVPPGRRPAAFALWYVGVFNAAGAAGTVLGGLAAQHGGYRILFVADAAANLVFAAAMLRLVPASPPPAETEGGGRQWRRALTDGRLLGFTAASLLAMTVYAQSIVTLPAAFARAGITPFGYGLICAANPAAVVLLAPLLQPVLRRRNRAGVCAAAAVTIGFGIALTGFGHGLTWYAATTVVWTLGEAAFMAAAPALVADLAPADLNGIYQGVWQTAMGGSLLLAPLAGGALLTLAGPRLLWTACAAAGVVAGLSCLIARRRT